MKTTRKTFGRYEVSVKGYKNGNKVSIHYVWSEKDKELFKENLAPSAALALFRDIYIPKGINRNYEAVKGFLWPYVELEF